MPNTTLLLTSLIVEEPAIGIKNNINLVFLTTYKFIPGTLEVFLGGSKLTKGINFDFIELANHQSFEIKLHNSPDRLKVPPFYDEDLVVNYLRL